MIEGPFDYSSIQASQPDATLSIRTALYLLPVATTGQTDPKSNVTDIYSNVSG